MPKPTRPKNSSSPKTSPYAKPAQTGRPARTAAGGAFAGKAEQRHLNMGKQVARPFTGKPFAKKEGSPAEAGKRKPESAQRGPEKRGPGKRDGRTARPETRRPEVARPEVSRPDLPAPYAMVARRASDTLRRGHLWVYASDVEKVDAGPGEAPALIPVVDTRGLLLGTALYSPASQILLRLISRELLTKTVWLEQLAARLRTAIGKRKPLLAAETNACRLAFSEADDLPGLILDKYADVLVLQLLVHGLDSAAVRQVCVDVIREEVGALEPGGFTLWERPDPRMRELEGLSDPGTAALLSTHAEPVAKTVFKLNGLKLNFDVNSGQKTGAFLDQRENYAAAARWAKATGMTGKVLDVCTYQGGFALHLAQVCREVTGLDTSRSSLEVAEKNLDLNKDSLCAEIDWIEGDAFEVMRAWAEPKAGSEADRVWDLIVLDPPAFAKSKRAVEGALRGYKELNLRALRMLKPGGLLVTCSCSHHVSGEALLAVVADAAVDAHRRVTLLERRGAAQDHPVVLNLPETEYLKCLMLQVD